MKKIYEFSNVWADQADLAVLKISAILLKYLTFEDGFFVFSWSIQNKLEFLLIVASMLKVGKLSILPHKYTFGGQNRLKHVCENVSYTWYKPLTRYIL